MDGRGDASLLEITLLGGLEVGTAPDPRMLRFVLDELDLDEGDVYEGNRILDYGILNGIADIDQPDLRFQPWRPLVPRVL